MTKSVTTIEIVHYTVDGWVTHSTHESLRAAQAKLDELKRSNPRKNYMLNAVTTIQLAFV